MRMWMVEPALMCDKHLIGEHLEIHMFVGAINRGTSMRGFLDGNLLEPMQLFDRHEVLVEEMSVRGFNHDSILPPINMWLPAEDRDRVIDVESARAGLLQRCPRCERRHKLAL